MGIMEHLFKIYISEISFLIINLMHLMRIEGSISFKRTKHLSVNPYF